VTAYSKASVTGGPAGERPGPLGRLLAWVFSTGLGTGLVPRGQGTLASAVFVGLWVLLVPRETWVELAVAVLLNLLSVPLSSLGERLWGPDPGRVTIDEFAGQSIALIALPREPLLLLAAFILFRLFDVFKLPVVRRRVETLPGGWGVTLDDTIAGLLARVLLVPLILLLA